MTFTFTLTHNWLKKTSNFQAVSCYSWFYFIIFSTFKFYRFSTIKIFEIFSCYPLYKIFKICSKMYKSIFFYFKRFGVSKLVEKSSTKRVPSQIQRIIKNLAFSRCPIHPPRLQGMQAHSISRDLCRNLNTFYAQHVQSVCVCVLQAIRITFLIILFIYFLVGLFSSFFFIKLQSCCCCCW